MDRRNLENLPLFPDPDGNTARKNDVVRLIEQAATRLGLATHSPQGSRLFGGHSLSVSGAQWLARSGVPLPLIQLMARWSSDVIARYVAEVPLKTISTVYKSEDSTRELRVLLDEARRSRDDSERVFGKMKTLFRDAFVAELGEVAELRPRSSLALSDSSPPFVVKTHVVANRSSKIRCGWAFGLAKFSFTHDCGPVTSRCSVCFRGEDVDAEDSLSG